MRLGALIVSFFLAVAAAQAQTAVTITTQPNAIVWIDGIRRGTTDSSGKLTLNKVSADARHSVRVRASGFKETLTFLLPGRRELAVKLWKTTDAGELKFQEAETARETARDDRRSVAPHLAPPFPVGPRPVRRGDARLVRRQPDAMAERRPRCWN